MFGFIGINKFTIFIRMIQAFWEDDNYTNDVKIKINYRYLRQYQDIQKDLFTKIIINLKKNSRD